MSTRFSDAEAAEIDAARGTMERGPWMREAALSVARRDTGIPQPIRIGDIEIPILVDERQPPGVVSVIAPGEDRTQVASFALAPEDPSARPPRPPAAKSRSACPHRLPSGAWCKACEAVKP